MKLESFQQKLLAAARATPPSDHVPPAFEKRILAHLRSSPQPDPAALWARAMWRAAIPCLMVTIVVGVFAFTSTPSADSEEAGLYPDLTQAFEQTMLAATDSAEDIW